MKSLNVIQTVSKIGKILSEIINVLCTVGIVATIVGMVSLPFAEKGLFKIGGVSVYGLIFSNEEINSFEPYVVLVGVMILCIGEFIVSHFSKKYFANELKAGTPFTQEGANELLKLGIITICVPIGAIVLSEIVCSIIIEFVGGGEVIDIEDFSTVSIGVMFIFLSLLCRYGSDVLKEKEA